MIYFNLLVEQIRRHSPFDYTFDNPVYFIYPNGMAPWSGISARDPADWYKDLNTGEMAWFDGSYEIEGYEHMGTNVRETDVENNTTLYDGDTKSEYYNGEFVKSYENEESLISFVSSNFLSPILSFTEKGGQSLINGFQGAGYGFIKSFTEDVNGMRFGEDFFVMDFNSDTVYNNGKWINIDPLSMGEKQFAKDFGVDATSSLLNFLGLPKFLKSNNRIFDEIRIFTRDSFIVESLENLLDD